MYHLGHLSTQGESVGDSLDEAGQGERCRLTEVGQALWGELQSPGASPSDLGGPRRPGACTLAQ